MNSEVLTFIEMCQWDPARFLIVSDNVFSPLIYYSHLLPLAVSLMLAGFIFIKNSKILAAKWLIVTTGILGAWLFFDLILWATEKPQFTMFFWSMINMVEPMIYAGVLFFAHAVIDGKDLSFKKKLIIFALLVPIVILMPTAFALVQYDLSNCYREAIEGPLAFYGYFVEVLFSLWILGLGVRRFFQTKAVEERKKIVLVIFGIVFFLLSFAMGNVIGSLLVDWAIGQYGLFGIPVFIALLVYLIVRYKTFNIKLIGAQALVAALWIALLALLFINSIEISRIIISLTLILFLIVGALLIRSVLREVRQREQISKMAEDVKRAYELEKKAKEEIEKLDKVKDQFLMTTQHNLRTPLTSIMGYSDLILNGTYGKQNKKTTEVIQKFQLLGKGMIKMVNDFLDAAQFQLGKDIVQLKPDVLLRPIIDELLNELRFKAEEKGIYLKVQQPQREFVITADREKLKAALFNIIDNSIKYTVKGGVVIKFEIRNSKFEIIVADTGIGIAPEHLDKLFNSMFERGANAKAFTKGSGVGLYLSYQIIKSHQGKVWAESAGEGKGSTFYVELPLG